jgi:cell division transport system ATP-binding protein
MEEALILTHKTNETMLINYKNVSVYQEDESVLEGVNFEVGAGDFIYIIGKVGSGKSSLLRTIYGELEIEEADEATVIERDMMHIRRKEIQRLRRELGIIFQDFKLLEDRNIYRNLEFVLKATGWDDKDDRHQRIEQVLREVKMEESAEKRPHELSGGEQQRIAIARSLLNHPKVILADEPTGNLDPETADNIMSLFKEIAATGTAVVITTHNMQMLSKFPGKVYVCDDGELKEYKEDVASSEEISNANAEVAKPNEEVTKSEATAEASSDSTAKAEENTTAQGEQETIVEEEF